MRRHEQAYQVRRHTLLTSMPDYGIPPTEHAAQSLPTASQHSYTTWLRSLKPSPLADERFALRTGYLRRSKDQLL